MSTNIQGLMKFLPEDLIKKQVSKEWRAKTKCLNKLPQNKHKVLGLITPMTKTIKFQGKNIDKHLDELSKQDSKPNYGQLEFIKYFQTEYVIKSLEKITGKSFLEPKKQKKPKRMLGLFN